MSGIADKPSILDLELPQIEGRSPYTAPTSHLVKTGANAWGEQPGRRVSKTMLVTGICEAVDAWRSAGHPGASAVTLRLFQYWFGEDHPLPGRGLLLRDQGPGVGGYRRQGGAHGALVPGSLRSDRACLALPEGAAGALCAVLEAGV